LSRLGLIDRYLARSIAGPLFGSLVLAAMLLVLDKMLRLFQYVVDAGGARQRRLADARQPASRSIFRSASRSA